MKKLLSIALCLIAVGGFAQKGKTKMAADFYGVDYSCVSVIGANEQPAEFIKAFEAINRLFLSEPKKYDVAGFTGIDILSTNVEQANEALGGLAAEQFTPRSTKADIAAQLPGILARYDNGSGVDSHDARQGQRHRILHGRVVRSRHAGGSAPDGHGRQTRRIRAAQLLGRLGIQRPQEAG